ncbi:3-(3-hydroxy-phenyl)propionate hydroxylase [Pseudohyphozyma bogoriensis]|nr:3-(3-hydroxy-phenyl)propionate hydroxylase [Pseudohyphozyma bogoriensis]
MTVPFPYASEVDVLIVGAGPAGLMLATWLSKLKVSCRIVDKREGQTVTGHADGVQCRTMEVFQSFGIGHHLVREGAHVNEVAFWTPRDDGVEAHLLWDMQNEPGTSRLPHVVLTQARIEAFLLGAMKDFNDLEVQNDTIPTSLKVTSGTHPVHVTLQTASSSEGDSPSTEHIRAKYLVGCDGARSWVRSEIGLSLKGDSSNAYWGVMDVLLKTDFPDIRLKCTIQSKSAGSILILPREKGLVRFYVQMGSTAEGERIDRSKVTSAAVIAKAQAIVAPYTLDVAFIEWWAVYEIGQRICDAVTKDNRVFIAGDAFHTHSPKAGQGMNVSMMDTYNLGWKLSGVLRGQLAPTVLDTYQSERWQTAKELIDQDAIFAKIYKKSAEGVLNDSEAQRSLKEFFISARKWASGTGVTYRPSLLVASSSTNPSPAPAIPVGMRFDSHQVVCLADARAWQLGDMMPSDGRFRIVLFGGDILNAKQKDRFDAAASYLSSSTSPITRYTPTTSDLDSTIEILTILSTQRTSLEITSLPSVLWPPKGPYGIRDYGKVFSDDECPFYGHGRAYEKYGVEEEGAVVVVRPDGYVAGVWSLEEVGKSGEYFDGFMLAPEEVAAA